MTDDVPIRGAVPNPALVVRDEMRMAWDARKTEPGWLPYHEAEAALARLAYTMIDEGKEDAPVGWAAKVMSGAVILLNRSKWTGVLEVAAAARLLTLGADRVEIPPSTRSTFAALHLGKVGLKGKLAPAQINPLTETQVLFGRVPQKWDGAILALGILAPDPNAIVREVNQTDSLLAAMCLMHGAHAESARKDVIASLWRMVKTGKDRKLRRPAMAALCFVADRASIPDFTNMLNYDKDFDVRISAAKALGALAGTNAVTPLLTAFKTMTEDDVIDAGTVQYNIAMTLAEIGLPAVPALLDTLRAEKDPIQRWKLLTAVIKIGNPDAEPSADLLTALSTEGMERGLAAAALMTALEQIGSPEALAMLEEWRAKNPG